MNSILKENLCSCDRDGSYLPSPAQPLVSCGRDQVTPDV